jgi:hypothetical protein
LVAGIGHWLLGSVNWLILVSLLLGSLPGIYLGSHFCRTRAGQDPAPTTSRDVVVGRRENAGLISSQKVAPNKRFAGFLPSRTF